MSTIQTGEGAAPKVRKVVEEVDVYLSLPAHQTTYCVSNHCLQKVNDFEDEVEMTTIRRKPLQHKVEFTYKGEPHTFKTQTKHISLRATQLLLEKEGDKVVARPITKILSQQPHTETETTTSANLDSKKATKGEIVRQLEGRLRTYQYQKEILALEHWQEYRLLSQPHNGRSLSVGAAALHH